MLKLRFLPSVLFCCLLLVSSSGSSFAQSPDAITESDVMAFIDSMDKAARKKNLAPIVAALADDVKIKLVISAQGSDKEEALNLNKEQWTYYTRRGLRRRLAYTLERKNTRMKMYDDKKTAMVTSDLYETMTVAQGKLRAVSSETAIVTLRNGKLVIISLETRARFY